MLPSNQHLTNRIAIKAPFFLRGGTRSMGIGVGKKNQNRASFQHFSVPLWFTLFLAVLRVLRAFVVNLFPSLRLILNLVHTNAHMRKSHLILSVSLMRCVTLFINKQSLPIPTNAKYFMNVLRWLSIGSLNTDTSAIISMIN